MCDDKTNSKQLLQEERLVDMVLYIVQVNKEDKYFINTQINM